MSIEKVEILREVAEFSCQNLQRVLSESLLINNSTFIKSKRIRDDEDDDWGTYNPPHPLMYGGITWESIAESLGTP
jgi:hypothetical protein